MLQIHEIYNILFTFYFGKIAKKTNGKIRDGLYRLSHKTHSLKNAACFSALILLGEFLYVFLGTVAKRHGRIFFSRIHIGVFRGSKLWKVLKFHIQDFDDPVPKFFHLTGITFAGLLCAGHIAESAKLPQLILKKRKIEIGTVGQIAEINKLLILTSEILYLLRCCEYDELHPRGTEQFFFVLHCVIRRALLKPLLRIRVADGLPVKVLKDFFQFPVFCPAAEIVRADLKRGISRRVSLLQKVVHRILSHQIAFSLIHLAKSGIHIDVAEIVSEKESEETVHRGDLGVVKKRLLPLQMGVPGFFFNPRGDGGSDPLPHLRRSRFRKSDYQKPVDIRRIIALADHSYDPLYEHCRFPASGRG